jgi:hypothetical protein
MVAARASSALCSGGLLCGFLPPFSVAIFFLRKHVRPIVFPQAREAPP